MPTPTAATWVKFFTNANIPSPAAATYAHVFVENRIQMDMLMDLNKEYLREMGITTMGDIIAILRHAKKVHEQSARDRVLCVPDSEITLPVATVSATQSTSSVSNGKKTEKAGMTRTVSATIPAKSESKARRVLPEHEGKYKITLPSGNTPRSREILQKKTQETKHTPNSSVAVGATSKVGTKRSSIFDRLNNDSEPPSKVTPRAPSLQHVTSSVVVSSSIFSRLGDRQADANGSSSTVRSTASSILKTSITNNGTTSAVTNIPPSQQKVILIKKMPAKAALPTSSDEDEICAYPAFGGSGIKTVKFSGEDEVLEIAPRKPHKSSASTPGSRLKFNEQEVSVKQRLGGVARKGANSTAGPVNRVPSFRGTKKVVHMKPQPKVSPVRSGLKSDSIGAARSKQPIKARLNLSSQTAVNESKLSIVKRMDRFSLDSKATNNRRSAPAGNSSGTVFDRLGYNRK
ncbi:uncharacterized protein C19orf47 [Anopheles marshallii]|uniref:uncharacterized protein C19orf47 n=1 Tax=Anopheles marshallii TaxID=1521116 RepID=UPI00237A8395|nr:uncharacterized protein C19orf47 [Anopheles marshallii]